MMIILETGKMTEFHQSDKQWALLIPDPCQLLFYHSILPLKTDRELKPWILF